MIQDPTRLSALLASLKQYTGEALTCAIVRDGVEKAVIFGVDNSGLLSFHACATSFTQAIAEAHDRGRVISAMRGGNNGDALAAKARQEGIDQESQLGQSEAVGGPISRSTAIAILQLRGMLSVVTNLPDLEAKIKDALMEVKKTEGHAAEGYLEGALQIVQSIASDVFQ